MQNNKQCYSYDSRNKITSTIKLQRDLMNGGFLPKPNNTSYDDPSLITLTENETLIIENEKWKKVLHYIGCKLYRKVDKKEMAITKIGESPEDYPDYTNKEIPNSTLQSYYIYSEESEEWDFDLEKYKINAIERVSTMCVEENYKMLPTYKRENVLVGDPASTKYPQYLQGEAGRATIAMLNAMYQNISEAAKVAINNATDYIQVNNIVDNIQFPTEEQILTEVNNV